MGSQSLHSIDAFMQATALVEHSFSSPLLPSKLATVSHRWNPAGMWYRDGSCRNIDGRQVIGAGACCTSRGLAERVNCVGVGATNTINRAEMCAGLYCLKRASLGADEVLATDTQVTMMVNPKRFTLYCHSKPDYLTCQSEAA